MDKFSAGEIIESIAEITKHVDRDKLEASLANTLHERLEIDRVAIYKVHYQYNQPKHLLMLEVVGGKLHIYNLEQATRKAPPSPPVIEQLDNCLKNKSAAVIALSKYKNVFFQPTLNHLNEVVSIFTLSCNENSYQGTEKSMKGYFQVYRNYLKLLNESEHDTLTGLLNRRTFDRDLDKLMTEWQEKIVLESDDSNHVNRRSGHSENGNWLAVVDIDFFKRINDEYGHLYGDEVLLLLANIMRESFRNYDKIFRFGGEEFVVILRDTGQEGAGTALNRFHKKVGDFHFPQVGNITVSIGYEEIANQTIPSEVLRLADDALYYVKEHGRNGVRCYGELLAEGKVKVVQAPVHDDIELF